MALYAIKMAASSRLPVVVVLGATGAGKSKLALEIGRHFKGEIISADSMQVYKGLDIITNKVTPQELEQCPHHMINYLSPLEENNTAARFRDTAIPIINSLLKQKKLPVIVGGTNYYIEALLWNYVISSQDILKALQEEPSTAKRQKLNEDVKTTGSLESKLAKTSAGSSTTVPELSSMSPDSPADKERYQDTDTQTLYHRLREVDPSSADRIYPSNRRKIVRALAVYDDYGIPVTEVYKAQQGSQALTHSGPLRYRDTCVLWVHSDQQVLDDRTNRRVDTMIQRGLVPELQGFHDDYNKSRVQTDGVADYTLGIFQSIGFKEFHKYLLMSSEDRDTEEGRQLFKQGVEDMKCVTRRYARKQVQWIRNRLLKRGKLEAPPVYKLDSTDVTQWETNVNKPAIEILTDILQGRQPKYQAEPQEESSLVRVHNVCDICGGRVFITLKDWNDHINGRKHQKRKRKLKQKLDYERTKKSTQEECDKEVKGTEGSDTAEEETEHNNDSRRTVQDL